MAEPIQLPEPIRDATFAGKPQSLPPYIAEPLKAIGKALLATYTTSQLLSRMAASQVASLVASQVVPAAKQAYGDVKEVVSTARGKGPYPAAKLVVKKAFIEPTVKQYRKDRDRYGTTGAVTLAVAQNAIAYGGAATRAAILGTTGIPVPKVPFSGQIARLGMVGAFEGVRAAAPHILGAAGAASHAYGSPSMPFGMRFAGGGSVPHLDKGGWQELFAAADPQWRKQFAANNLKKRELGWSEDEAKKRLLSGRHGENKRLFSRQELEDLLPAGGEGTTSAYHGYRDVAEGLVPKREPGRAMFTSGVPRISSRFAMPDSTSSIASPGTGQYLAHLDAEKLAEAGPSGPWTSHMAMDTRKGFNRRFANVLKSTGLGRILAPLTAGAPHATDPNYERVFSMPQHKDFLKSAKSVYKVVGDKFMRVFGKGYAHGGSVLHPAIPFGMRFAGGSSVPRLAGDGKLVQYSREKRKTYEELKEQIPKHYHPMMENLFRNKSTINLLHKDARFLGAGVYGMGFHDPAGDVLRFQHNQSGFKHKFPQLVSTTRPAEPEILQPTDTINIRQGKSRTVVERLPYAADVPQEERERAQMSMESLLERGYEDIDLKSDNIGKTGSKYVVRDPAAVRFESGKTPRKRSYMQKLFKDLHRVGEHPQDINSPRLTKSSLIGAGLGIASGAGFGMAAGSIAGMGLFGAAVGAAGSAAVDIHRWFKNRRQMRSEVEGPVFTENKPKGLLGGALNMLGLKRGGVVPHFESGGSNLPSSLPSWHMAEGGAFEKWFGGSKVVDEEGKPRPVYHGTTKSFNSFDLSTKIKHPADDAGLGAFHPSQVKSTKNRGTYSPTDPNIHHARGGRIPRLADGGFSSPDTQPAKLAPESYVVNEASSKANPWLDQIPHDVVPDQPHRVFSPQGKVDGGKMPAALQPGEKVYQPDVARKYAPLLQAANEAKGPLKMAEGGEAADKPKSSWKDKLKGFGKEASGVGWDAFEGISSVMQNWIGGQAHSAQYDDNTSVVDAINELSSKFDNLLGGKNGDNVLQPKEGGNEVLKPNEVMPTILGVENATGQKDIGSPDKKEDIEDSSDEEEEYRAEVLSILREIVSGMRELKNMMRPGVGTPSGRRGA